MTREEIGELVRRRETGGGTAVLDIGCGLRRAEAGAIGLDWSPESGAEAICDVNLYPWPLPDSAFGRVHMSHIIEHLDDIVRGMKEVHRVLCDQPADNGGSNGGMTPPEFLLVSLGTCAGFYATQYLRTRGLPAEGLEIKVSAEKAKQPARLGSFRIEVLAPALDPRHEEGLLRAVKACLVHNTLINAPAIETVVHAGALV